MTPQTTRPHGGTNTTTGTGDTCATSPAGSSAYGHAVAIQTARPAAPSPRGVAGRADILAGLARLAMAAPEIRGCRTPLDAVRMAEALLDLDPAERLDYTPAVTR